MKTKTKISHDSVKNVSARTAPRKRTEIARDLNGLFINQLKDIYWTEKALIKATSKMVDQVSSKELKDALQDHLDETKEHVTRLEKVFSLLDIKPETKKSEAISGLIDEAEEMIKETEKGSVRDAGIIFACQRIEHYEIATYGTLCSFAKILEETDALSLLEDTIKEEKEGDERLTEIAESIINIEALQEQE